MSATKSDEYVPKALREIQKHIRSTNNILRQFKNRFIKRNDDINTWPENYRLDLISTMTSMNIDEPQWFTTIKTSLSVSALHWTIKRILDHLLSRHQLEHKLMTNKRIEQFIQARCLNYTDDPKKLIDSLLERNSMVKNHFYWIINVLCNQLK